MFLITGDRHGDVASIDNFANRIGLNEEDTIIILGDAGFLYFVRKRHSTGLYRNDGAINVLKKLAKIPCHIVVIQGNHEAPAWLCEFMYQTEYGGSIAYSSPVAPNVIFLKNGEIYNIDGKDYLVMGGGYSVDIARRTVPYAEAHGGRWYFPEELMTDEEFARAEELMQQRNYQVHGILSHTCPLSKQPRDLFLSVNIKPKPNNEMEEKFEVLANRYSYDIWYFGHYHDNRRIDDKFMMLYYEVQELR
jgi:3-oxoacid CoA-transferase subunit A